MNGYLALLLLSTLFLTSLPSCKKDTNGCTDPLAENYNKDADSDDEGNIGAVICDVQSKMVDQAISASNIFYHENIPRQYQKIPQDFDEVASVLHKITPVLNDDTLLRRIEINADYGLIDTKIEI